MTVWDSTYTIREETTATIIIVHVVAMHPTRSPRHLVQQMASLNSDSVTSSLNGNHDRILHIEKINHGSTLSVKLC